MAWSNLALLRYGPDPWNGGSKVASGCMGRIGLPSTTRSEMLASSTPFLLMPRFGGRWIFSGTVGLENPMGSSLTSSPSNYPPGPGPQSNRRYVPGAQVREFHQRTH